MGSDLVAGARRSANLDDLELLRALRRTGRLREAYAQIIDKRGPENAVAFVARGTIVTKAGHRYTAEASATRAYRSKVAAAGAVLEELRTNEPSHPLSPGPTKRQLRAAIALGTAPPNARRRRPKARTQPARSKAAPTRPVRDPRRAGDLAHRPSSR
ncbi:MAG: hypothetical protein M0P31_17655 [Solirubrobacteraceae bacterium]|nr:hypothetical protein [Solirubrobacteraceae bacterium]